MAKIVDPLKLTRRQNPVPGLKPPIHSFAPQDSETPQEADTFRHWVRELRREDRLDLTPPQ